MRQLMGAAPEFSFISILEELTKTSAQDRHLFNGKTLHSVIQCSERPISTTIASEMLRLRDAT